MPKIFLIKNRLHQQQLKLLESQNATAQKNDLGIGDSQPLPLIVQKKDGKDFIINNYNNINQYFNMEMIKTKRKLKNLIFVYKN